MRQTVERILNGKFDYEKGTLDIETPRIELALKPGEIYTGSFFIKGRSGCLSEGNLYCNDIRMRLLIDSFAGTGSEIGYTFSAMGLEEGDVVQGEISIISNQGEYYLPYVVTIRNTCVTTSLGTIKNLFHFTNLAKSNWNEAVKLFYSDEFLSVFTGNDIQYKKIYLGLSKYYGNEQNVEEFLLSINKKQPIEYIPERKFITMDAPIQIAEEYINITRNGWGYTMLNASSEGDFIFLEKNQITDDDFLGNYISFPVRINPERLHAGLNFGKITFFNSYSSFEIDVTVNKETFIKSEMSKHLELEHLATDLQTFYIAFRTKRITADAWIGESMQVVERMLQIDENHMLANLFKAQLLLAMERYNEAKWILDKVQNELTEAGDNSSSKWAYYLYLSTLYDRDEAYIDKVTEEIWSMYRNSQTDWRMAWFLLYLSMDFAVSPSKRWLFVQETIEKGCISPMFYVEAVNMLITNPGLLTALTGFEYRVLFFAAKNDLLTSDLIRQFVYLASKEKHYSQKLFFLLKKCYEVEESLETATVITDLCIKGDRRDSEAGEWYLLAINEELRVTKLYEYYMESLDITRPTEIPKMVFLYFSYESELDWEHNAYLYASMLAEKDKYPDIFETYKPLIENFASSGILKGYMNKDMAAIYKYVLSNFDVTDEMAEMLSKILFVHRIRIDAPNISKLVIYQSRETSEQVYPIEDGVVYVPVYNKDYTILFEDGFSNRYAKSIDYDLEKLMVPGKIASMILFNVKNNLEFDIYACECSPQMADVNDVSREKYRNILEAQEVETAYKTEVRAKLIKYYYDSDRIKELDEVLDSLNPTKMEQRDRVMAISYMVTRGMYDRVMEWLSDYGTEGVDPKDLVKLCSKLITRSDYTENTDITKIAATVFFKGKYDEVILKYLVTYYCGMTKDMRRIFNAAQNFEVEIYKMCENMLLQMLYTGYFVSERMDIYRMYVRGGADADIRNAFLAQCSFDYFVKEQVMENFVFDELTRLKERGENLQTVCKLAYLKYYSTFDGKITEEVMNIIKEFLSDLQSAGIYMSFFKNFMETTTAEVNKYSDKTIIEYKTDPGKKVFIHYIIEGDGDDKGEYMTEEMADMYYGVHAKAFILFFGENLLYYITEESEGEELLTESASIQKSDISRDISESRFNEINDIVIAKTLQDYDTVDNLLYDYNKHAYIVRKMFKLL